MSSKQWEVRSQTLRAKPMTDRGKPYVSIMADHSEPGRTVKYAPNPYLRISMILKNWYTG